MLYRPVSLRGKTINKTRDVNHLTVRTVLTPVLWKDHVPGELLLGAGNVLFLKQEVVMRFSLYNYLLKSLYLFYVVFPTCVIIHNRKS